ncbi:hypothetical protein AMTRI_Chr09g12680 [Amborella trichopoda]
MAYFLFGTLMDCEWVAEQAREELQKLESDHPNRFGFLKKEFQALLTQANPPASSATTAVSTNRKRKAIDKDYCYNGDNNNGRKCKHKKRKKEEKEERSRGRDSADSAIERAQACLNKLRQFKDFIKNHSRTAL